MRLEKSFLNGVTMPPAPRIQNVCSLRKKQRKKKPRLPHLTPEQSLQSHRINAKTSGEDISSDFPLSPFPVVCLCLSSSGGGAFAVGGGGVGGESIIRLKILIVGGKERGLCWAQVERGENEAAVVTPLNGKGREISSQVEGLKMYLNK